jgi:hypothetical protein
MVNRSCKISAFASMWFDWYDRHVGCVLKGHNIGKRQHALSGLILIQLDWKATPPLD